MITLLHLFAFVVLTNIHGTSGETCTQTRYIGDFENNLLTTCEYGCCGTEYSRVCCDEIVAHLRGGAIAGIVIGCVIVVAIVVGIILCCVCCVKAASNTNPRRGVVMSRGPGPQVSIVTQGTGNNAYTPPAYTAYNMSQPPQATMQNKY